MISRNALSLCLSPRSTRKEARLTLFFLFFFRGPLSFLQSVQSFSPTTFRRQTSWRPFTRPAESPHRFSALPGGSAARTGPLCRATRHVLLMSGMKGSLKEPSGLVSRFLRGREDGAEIRNDFHFLYRANYVQRCFFLSFFHLRGKLLHDGTEDVWFQDRSRHKYL